MTKAKSMPAGQKKAIKVTTESERAECPPRRGPYWVKVKKGQALGYQRGPIGAVWVANSNRHGRKILGVPPEERYQCDYPVLTFDQAMVAAQLWLEEVLGQVQDPLRTNIGLEPWRPEVSSMPQHPTVGDALDEFLIFHKWLSIKSLSNSRSFHHRIKQAIGHIRLCELDSRCLWVWQNDIIQPGPDEVKEEGTIVDFYQGPDDPEEGKRWRKKRRIANRLLGYLKTALDRAYYRGWVDSDLAWRRVLPWPNARESCGRSTPDRLDYLQHLASLGDRGGGAGCNS